MADRYLDCKALRCPLPIVRVSQAVGRLEAGQTLLVEADDPVFGPDIEAWIEMTGNELLELQEGPVYRALIRKKAGD